MEHAEKQGDLYAVVGMGGCFKYENMNQIRKNRSLGYDMGPNPEHLEKMRAYLPEFKLVIA